MYCTLLHIYARTFKQNVVVVQVIIFNQIKNLRTSLKKYFDAGIYKDPVIVYII